VSDLLFLSLGELEQPLKIHSRALDADLWLVPEGCADGDFDAPAYTLDECRLLLALDLSPNELRAIHLTKTLFEGDLVLSADPDSLRRLYSSLLQKFRDLEKGFSERTGNVDEADLLQLARHLSRLLDHVDAIDKAGAHDLP